MLRGVGHETLTPSLAGAVEAGPPYYARLAERAAEPIGAGLDSAPVVLIGHSGAGALLPAIAEAARVPLSAAIFVDALLPHPATSWLDTAPQALGTHLRGLERDGRLPPWDRWFPPGAVAALLPDDRLRGRFLGELPSLPLAYLEEPAPAVAAWLLGRCGYLRLSDAYEDVAAEAEQRGWLTVREPADHLAMVTRPDAVAAILHRMVADLTGA